VTQHGLKAAVRYRWQTEVETALHGSLCEVDVVKYNSLTGAPNYWGGVMLQDIRPRRSTVVPPCMQGPALQLNIGGLLRRLWWHGAYRYPEVCFMWVG
jgi:hypothetical protein